MQRNEILHQLQQIVRAHVHDPSIRLTEATVAEDVADWDSVAHVAIIVNVEQHFGIRFESEEYMEFATVGEMVDCVERRLTRKKLESAGSAASPHGA